MPQSLSFLLVHLIFSTKGRLPLLVPELRPALFAYLAAVARGTGCECLRVGGVEDHVHLAVRLTRTQTVAELVEEIKTASSRWLKSQSFDLAYFAWQRGYGAFSLGAKDLAALTRYIDLQEEHHRHRDFQTEYRALLASSGLDYDERYVWD